MSLHLTGVNKYQENAFSTSDSFYFHVMLKTVMRKFFDYIQLPEKWFLPENLQSNTKVIYGIFKDYEKYEKQNHRRSILGKVIPFAILLYNYDENYREVMNWFFIELLKHKDEFVFPLRDLQPDCWWQDGRGRTKPDLSKVEGLVKTTEVVPEEINPDLEKEYQAARKSIGK